MAYRTRPIRYLQQWEPHGWRLKVYGISASGDPLPPELVAAAEVLVGKSIPSTPLADGRHGVGFAGVHDGAMASFVFASWWGKTYELNHILFRGPKGRPGELAPVEQGLFGCTWDLRVISFERDAWIASMLGPNDGPNLDAYMAATFNADT